MPAFAVLGLSDTVFSGGSLPFAPPGAPGCDLLVSPDVWVLIATNTAGEGRVSYPVPGSTSLISLELFHQWVIADPVNPLGVVTSNAAKSTIGN